MHVFVVCPFVLFLLAIVLSVLLRYTDYDCPFGVFKLFLCKESLNCYGQQFPCMPYSRSTFVFYIYFSIISDILVYNFILGLGLWRFQQYFILV